MPSPYPFNDRASPWAQAPMVAKSALIESPLLARYPMAAKMYAFREGHRQVGNLLHPSVPALVSERDAVNGLGGGVQTGMTAAAASIGLGVLAAVLLAQFVGGYVVGKALCPPGQDDTAWKWGGAALGGLGLPFTGIGGPIALGGLALYAYSKETRG